MTIELYLCDVFAERPLNGNSLTVVIHDEPLAPEFMQALTRELRQFETAFLQRTTVPEAFDTHVFDLTRELAFAGHPLLGAAAVLHEVFAREVQSTRWQLRMPRGRHIDVASSRVGPAAFLANMNQGAPVFGATATRAQTARAADAFSLTPRDLIPGLAPAVVSTGLRYLIVPIRSGLPHAKVVHPDLQRLLLEVDAEFAYLLDVPTMEARHWENDGSVEDTATGSAAGAVGGFLVAAGLAEPTTTIELSQGRFVGRPSTLRVVVRAVEEEIVGVDVAGPVALLGQGVLRNDLTTAAELSDDTRSGRPAADT